MAEKLRYDKTLLGFIVSRDNITLVGEYDKLGAKSRIEFICQCSNRAEKDMRSIFILSGIRTTRASECSRRAPSSEYNEQSTSRR
jgi:hypothetical protein